MSLLTLDQARLHCRVTGTAEDALLQSAIESASDIAAAYLNRQIYATAMERDAALDAAPSALSAAGIAYDLAMIDITLIEDDIERTAAAEVARRKLAAAKDAFRRTLDGVVLNDSIVAALNLIVGQLYIYRENLASSATAELPLGAHALLRPYRKVMMP